jgi:hypothetical protein
MLNEFSSFWRTPVRGVPSSRLAGLPSAIRGSCAPSWIWVNRRADSQNRAQFLSEVMRAKALLDLRDYLNLKKTGTRLARLLQAFHWQRMDEIFLPVSQS